MVSELGKEPLRVEFYCSVVLVKTKQNPFLYAKCFLMTWPVRQLCKNLQDRLYHLGSPSNVHLKVERFMTVISMCSWIGESLLLLLVWPMLVAVVEVELLPGILNSFSSWCFQQSRSKVLRSFKV